MELNHRNHQPSEIREWKGRRPRLLFFVSNDWYFVSHRLPLATAALDEGFRVRLLTSVNSHSDQILAAGVELEELDGTLASVNPVRDAAIQARTRAAYRTFKPDIVHHVGLKPVLHGSWAARALGIAHTVNAVSGLGYVFSSEDLRARLLRYPLRWALGKALDTPGSTLIIQNEDDLSELQSLANRELNSVLIRGSGVSLEDFRATQASGGLPLVILPSRMLRDKGVIEFVEASKQLKEEGVRARFALVGRPDPGNPTSIPKPLIRKWEAEGAIEYWGWRDDMPQVLEEASIVCLPSYREGLPKALIEAAASARAIVSTDVPGCRDVVVDGYNGLLVKPRSSRALAAALKRLIVDTGMREMMGFNSRVRAEALFSFEFVRNATIDLYRESLGMASTVRNGSSVGRSGAEGDLRGSREHYSENDPE